jgi:thymidine kinase
MDFSSSPSIDIIIGPMFSGKTTEIFRRLVIFSDAKYSVLYINSNLDTRSELASTHNLSLKLPDIKMVKTQKLLDAVSICESYDIIAIDEGQFFEDLVDFCILVCETYKKKVIVGGLNGDYRRSAFGKINDLVPICDSITKLYPFCKNCIEKQPKTGYL